MYKSKIVQRWTHLEAKKSWIQASNAGTRANFLTTLLDEKIKWVLDWTDYFKLAFHTKSSTFILLLRTQGILAHISKRFFKQLERVQKSPLTLDLTSFTINFDKKSCLDQIPMKIPITKTWGTLSNDKSIAYIPKFKQIALVTSQYGNWPRDFDTQQPRVIQSEEVKRLMAIIEAKDRANMQLK